jgi:hypothetical protein
VLECFFENFFSDCSSQQHSQRKVRHHYILYWPPFVRICAEGRKANRGFEFVVEGAARSCISISSSLLIALSRRLRRRACSKVILVHSIMPRASLELPSYISRRRNEPLISCSFLFYCLSPPPPPFPCDPRLVSSFSLGSGLALQGSRGNALVPSSFFYLIPSSLALT